MGSMPSILLGFYVFDNVKARPISGLYA